MSCLSDWAVLIYHLGLGKYFPVEPFAPIPSYHAYSSNSFLQFSLWHFINLSYIPLCNVLVLTSLRSTWNWQSSQSVILRQVLWRALLEDRLCLSAAPAGPVSASTLRFYRDVIPLTDITVLTFHYLCFMFRGRRLLYSFTSSWRLLLLFYSSIHTTLLFGVSKILFFC